MAHVSLRRCRALLDACDQKGSIDVTSDSSFWFSVLKDLEEEFDELRFRHLLKCFAVLSLKESCDWSYELIGRLFGHHKGHMKRLHDQGISIIRERFALEELSRNEVDRAD